MLSREEEDRRRRLRLRQTREHLWRIQRGSASEYPVVAGPPAGGGGGPPEVPVVGDIVAARVAVDGWTLELDILGFKVGGNVNRGRNPSGDYPGTGGVTVGYDLTPFTAPKVTLACGNRAGFDAITGASAPAQAFNSYGSISKRKAYSVGGDEQKNDETDGGTFATIRLSLTNRIAAGETVALTALADLYRDNGPGGSGAPSNAITNLTVTNGSAWTIKKPICAYLTPARQRLTDVDFTFEALAVHRYGRLGRTLAAMVFTWTGQTSTVSISKTVTAMSLSSFLRAANPRASVYKATLTAAEIATFTQGEEVRWTVEARPFWGPAFTALTDGEAYPTTRMQTYLPFVCDKGNTLDAYATVDPAGALTSASTAGCTANNVEQTNTANCYSTITGALAALNTFMGRSEVAGAVIYLRAGTYNDFGTTATTALGAGLHWVTITKAPSATRANVILTTLAGQSITGNGRRLGGHIRFKDVTLTTAAAAGGNDNVIIHGPDNTAVPTRGLWLDGCICASQSTHATPTSFVSQYGEQYWTNCDGSGRLRMTLSIGRGFNLIAGNVFDNAGLMNLAGPFVANRLRNTSQVVAHTPNTANVINPDQALYAFNDFSGSDPVTIAWHTGAPSQTYSKGVAILSNVTENWNNASQTCMAISCDGDSNPNDNVVRAFNTSMGERTNFQYNDIGTVSVSKDGVEIGNIDMQRFIKRDTFAHPTNGKQAARTGNWTVSHAVDSRFNFTTVEQFGYNAVSSNSDIGDAWHNGGIVATIPFVDNRSGVGGAGGGDYRLTGTNAAIGVIPASLEWLPFTVDGVARAGDAGALSHV